MKRRILILLLWPVITTCFGQNLNTAILENLSNQNSLGIAGRTTGESYVIIRSTLGVGGFSQTITTNDGGYVICQSIGQNGVIGTFNNDDYTFIQGFQQPISSSKVFQLPIEETLFASLYPNPFYHYINISFKDRISEEILVQLTDITGKTIFFKEYPASQLITLHLDHLNSGMYIMKVSINNKQFRANIIKQYR